MQMVGYSQIDGVNRCIIEQLCIIGEDVWDIVPSGEIVRPLLRDITASRQADAAIEAREPGRVTGDIATTNDSKVERLIHHATAVLKRTTHHGTQVIRTPTSIPA